MMVSVPGTGMIIPRPQENRVGDGEGRCRTAPSPLPCPSMMMRARIIMEAPAVLPEDVTPVTVRPDTAGCQAALVRDGNRPGDRPDPLQPHP